MGNLKLLIQALVCSKIPKFQYEYVKLTKPISERLPDSIRGVMYTSVEKAQLEIQEQGSV